jgi:hypothetical protein
MQLEFRVVRTGMTTSPYALERLDKLGCVTAVRPASKEEWTLFCLAMRRLP